MKTDLVFLYQNISVHSCRCRKSISKNPKQTIFFKTSNCFIWLRVLQLVCGQCDQCDLMVKSRHIWLHCQGTKKSNGCQTDIFKQTLRSWNSMSQCCIKISDGEHYFIWREKLFLIWDDPGLFLLYFSIAKSSQNNSRNISASFLANIVGLLMLH